MKAQNAMRVTLRDLARTCGVDVSTVSRALREDPRVRARTAARIRRKALELHYAPNSAARSLVAGRTHTVWMILPTLTHPLERDPAEQASHQLRERGYDLLIALYGSDLRAYSHWIGRLRQGVADGAIVIPGLEDNQFAEPYRVLDGGGYPLVFLDRFVASLSAPVVTSDNEAGAARLVQMCAERGVRRFVVHFPAHNVVSAARREAALREIRTLGYAGWAVEDGPLPAAARQGREHVAVLGPSQDHITGFLGRHNGWLDGRRLTIAQFDEWFGNPHPAERVVTCVQDFDRMTQTAVNRLIDMIEGRASMARDVTRIPPRDYRVIE